MESPIDSLLLRDFTSLPWANLSVYVRACAVQNANFSFCRVRIMLMCGNDFHVSEEGTHDQGNCSMTLQQTTICQFPFLFFWENIWTRYSSAGVNWFYFHQYMSTHILRNIICTVRHSPERINPMIGLVVLGQKWTAHNAHLFLTSFIVIV